MEEYKTIKEPAFAAIVERKSEFIGYITPVKTEEEAIAFINKTKKKHVDARHNVYAYILRDNNITRFSDDGEPHGTAGLPVLELLRKEELIDVAVVITRYFGGILLGTGGLLRAYTAAAKAALDKAVPVLYKNFSVISITASYSDYPKIDFYLAGISCILDNIEYGTDVVLLIAMPTEDFNTLKNQIIDITSSRAVIKFIGNRYDFIKV
ncbi:MAG: YigZ family protein [Clostridiales bacterium GWF2_36_10]|nr:MAG: YigZ family protein [Clostridiales bacterium GWF2_36_10]